MNKFPNVNLNELYSYVEHNKKRMYPNNNSVYKKMIIKIYDSIYSNSKNFSTIINLETQQQKY